MSIATFFVSAPRGLEKILFEEIEEIAGKYLEDKKDLQITLIDGGVSITSSFDFAYLINLYSRIASRVFWLISQGYYRSDIDVFHLAKKINWQSLFTVDKTIRVDVSAVFSPLKSITIVALRTKDAICDHFRDNIGARPSVEKSTPDIRVRVFLERNTVKFYLDTSGEPLFKRGYRFRHNPPNSAPIRENLAAGMLRIIGWQPNQPLLDPFCGSGTIAIEAAQIAINHPAGIGRKFTFENMLIYQEKTWREILRRAHEKILDIYSLINTSNLPQIIIGDKNMASVNYAQSIIRELDYQDIISTYCGKFQKFDNKLIDINKKPILIANPPYGERMGDTNELFFEYQEWGGILKHQYAGWNAGFITSNPDFIKGIALKPKFKVPLMNGDLDAKFYVIPLFSGTRKKTLIDKNKT